MSHQIIADLNQRYTTKKYDSDKRISADDLEIIKEALRLSPSSINSQPWKFIIIESDAAKQRLHDTFVNIHPFNQPHAKEASHTLLLAHNPYYNKDDNYRKVADAEVRSGHLPESRYNDFLNGAFAFAEANTDDQGFNGDWTRSQVYLALGNIMHTLARLGIHSTAMEGIDSAMISEIFSKELDGHVCDVALAMGYPLESEDYNYGKPKARLAQQEVVSVI